MCEQRSYLRRKKSNGILFWYLVTCCVLLTVACSTDIAVATDAELTEVPKAPATSQAVTATLTPSQSPNTQSTPEATNPPTPTLSATPALSESLLANDLFFGTSSVPGCELPCWQGLIVGTSGREEIQSMYEDVFGFPSTYQFIRDDAPETDTRFLPPEYYGGGYLWDIKPENPETLETFGVSFVYERDSFELVQLELISSYPPYNILLSPQRVMRELGQPAHIFIGLFGTKRGDILNSSVIMIYREGLFFDFSDAFIPTNPHDDIVQICLGHKYWQTDQYGKGFYVIRIYEPFRDDGLNDLTPVQEAELGALASGEAGVVPLSDYFGVSLEEITQLALQDEDACLTTSVTE